MVNIDQINYYAKISIFYNDLNCFAIECIFIDADINALLKFTIRIISNPISKKTVRQLLMIYICNT
jgi:hypothetical protein